MDGQGESEPLMMPASHFNGTRRDLEIALAEVRGENHALRIRLEQVTRDRDQARDDLNKVRRTVAAIWSPLPVRSEA